ncbi:hypothetical protein AACH06_21055 [Ideonella sp. DXS29W]|uniref:ABM domain-containing protein n=1 Tax=Ideonella lacteola TaxID=2984193 RepID=A0ABU9BWT8_9BURK
MSTEVIEIVKWKSKPGVLDRDVVEAAAALVPDLQAVGGFISKTLYSGGGEWVDVYHWETVADAERSNERMAQKTSLLKLLSLVQPETVSISVLSQA